MKLHPEILAGWLMVSLLAVTNSVTAADPPGVVKIDTFDDADLVTSTGGQWQSFVSSGDASSVLPIQHVASDSGMALRVSGRLPGSTGASWGGLFCSLRREDKTADLSPYSELRFRVRSDYSDYYRVRIEDAAAKHHSTDVVFPVDHEYSSIAIPLWRFTTGVSNATRITFIRDGEAAGAPFCLELDDVELMPASNATPDMRTGVDINWSASESVARMEALNAGKPLVLYFTTDVTPRCRDFERDVFESPRFAGMADAFQWCLIDVLGNREALKKYNISRVPAIVIQDLQTNNHVVLEGSKADADSILNTLSTQAQQSRRSVPPPPVQFASSERQVRLDDFEDGNVINRGGGEWGGFSKGDRGDVQCRLLRMSTGGYALEGYGTFPTSEDGTTWGGLFGDLSAGRKSPRNLSTYKNLEFFASTTQPGLYQVRIENPRDTHQSTTVSFVVSERMQAVRIPLTDFTSGVEESSTIVFSKADPMPGQKFHLIIDDVIISR